MQEGILKYNEMNNRYGLWNTRTSEWIDSGFHCGECVDVYDSGNWIHSRVEMDMQRKYYLVGTSYRGNLENIPAKI